MENQAASLSLYNYCIMCAWCLGRPHKITMNLNTVTKHNTYIYSSHAAIYTCTLYKPGKITYALDGKIPDVIVCKASVSRSDDIDVFSSIERIV